MIPGYCTDQPFDASVLGRPVWRLTDPSHAEDSIQAAWAQGVGLMVYRGPEAPPGFRHVETLITFEGTVSEGCMPEMARPATPDDAEVVAEIARVAFMVDRWHADPSIPNDKADAFKAAWARNAVLGRADRVFVAEREGRVIGFNAVMSRDTVLVIDLIAVSPGNQGLGFGRALIEAMGSMSIERVRVGTQASNAASVALYEALGFEPVSRVETWHWTP